MQIISPWRHARASLRSLFALAALAAASFGLSPATPAQAQTITTRSVEYKDGDVTLEGYLAYNPTFSSLRPGVMIVHQWKGLGNYEKQRAQMLARLGYVAFAVDIYGKGVRPESPAEAGATAGKYRADRALLRRRAAAGLAKLKSLVFVDKERIAAIGYCFGGGAVLELARSGADLQGVVSFHGNLDTPNPADAKAIRAKVLVCHGAVDPAVPDAQVKAFTDEMTAAKTDWQLIAYGGAVHSFTDWNAGSDHTKTSAYNRAADKRSWAAMQQFFSEIFAR